MVVAMEMMVAEVLRVVEAKLMMGKRKRTTARFLIVRQFCSFSQKWYFPKLSIMLSLSPVSPTAVYMSLDIPAQLDSQAPQACLPPTTHVSGSDFIFNSVQPLLSLICRNYITIYMDYMHYMSLDIPPQLDSVEASEPLSCRAPGAGCRVPPMALHAFIEWSIFRSNMKNIYHVTRQWHPASIILSGLPATLM